MSVLTPHAVRMLDDMFAEATAFFDTGDYQAAYRKCDEIKRQVQAYQKEAYRKLVGPATVVGAVGGMTVPGVGNLVGEIVGGALGHFFARLLHGAAFTAGGTIEDIAELASAGKSEAMLALRGFR